MAVYTPTSVSPETVKKWARQAWGQVAPSTIYGIAFMKGAIASTDEFIGANAKGDELTVSAFRDLRQAGLYGNSGDIEASAEALQTDTFKMAINQVDLSIGVNADYTIATQRVQIPESEYKRAVMSAGKRFGQFLDLSFLHQVTGVIPNTAATPYGTFTGTAAQKLQITGCNTVDALDTTRILRIGGAANDQSVTSADTLSTRAIDLALERITSGEFIIEPADDGRYHMFVPPESELDIKTNISSTTLGWFPMQLATRESGREDQLTKTFQRGNPSIRTLGEYNNVVIHVCSALPAGVNSGSNEAVANVKRSVLLGKNAAMFASNKPFRFTEATQDVPFVFNEGGADPRKPIVLGTYLGGLKRCRAVSQPDRGAFVFSHWAAPHN
jgi:hypothetical protein